MAPASAALRFTLRPSRRLVILLMLAHAGALVLVLMLPLPWPAMLVLWLATLVSMGWSISIAFLRRSAIVELIHEAEGEWALRDAAGNAMMGRLLPGSYLHPQLVVLNFARNGERWRLRRVVILADMLDADSFRRLRVWLLAGSHSPLAPE